MTVCNVEQIVDGIAEAKRGNTRLGIQLLQDVVETVNLPEAKAWLGYCFAKENNEIIYGIKLCKEILTNNPRSTDVHLALARIYLLADRRLQAINTLEQGLKLAHSQEIHSLLTSIGVRKTPVLRFLCRSNRVNVTSGRFLTWMGLR
jgi:hypothetical protein